MTTCAYDALLYSVSMEDGNKQTEMGGISFKSFFIRNDNVITNCLVICRTYRALLWG